MKHRHFIIAGAQRSGTTYLYELLAAHPEVCMATPVKPEPKYFLGSEKTREYSTYLSRFFRDCEREAVLGEKSTSYYESEGVAERIAELIPEARIVFMLRDPVERAISNYFFSRNNGIESRSLREVFLQHKAAPAYDRSSISVNPFDYLGRGEYAIFIQKYIAVFGAEQVGVFFFEELTKRLEALEALYEFIGVDRSFVPECFAEQVNAAQRHTVVTDDVTEALRQYYLQPNQRLSVLLGRELPW